MPRNYDLEHIGAVKRALKAVLEKHLNAKIIAIDIREDVDRDGDDVLLVEVVSEGPLDVRAATGIVRHALPALEQLHEDRFPILSFIDKDDFRGRVTETA